MEEYYIKELCKLLIIIEGLESETKRKEDDTNVGYIKEKVIRILGGVPISIHQNIKPHTYIKIVKYDKVLETMEAIADDGFTIAGVPISARELTEAFDLYEERVNKEHLK